jgi:hypothetical protein
MTSIIATTPDHMVAAQSQVLSWCDQRLIAAKHDWTLAEQTFNALERVGARTQPASTLMNKAKRRIVFYEKVRKAVELGYVIVPPFDLQIFAIRTDRAAPELRRSESSWQKDATPRLLPPGEGDYKNAVVPRFKVDSVKYKNKDGSDREVAFYENADEWGDMEIPVRALKPQIIDAVDVALKAKVFDELGIAPQYRAADPVICGRIRRPDKPGRSITFMVAWWLDFDDV